jgi:hypothetical protein
MAVLKLPIVGIPLVVGVAFGRRQTDFALLIGVCLGTSFTLS